MNNKKTQTAGFQSVSKFADDFLKTYIKTCPKGVPILLSDLYQKFLDSAPAFDPGVRRFGCRVVAAGATRYLVKGKVYYIFS